MIPKNLNDITEADLQVLLDNSVAEGRTIEYKRDLPGNADKDKKDFLTDVSAFANASGGDLIYGIDAKDGIPISVTGNASNLFYFFLRALRVFVVQTSPTPTQTRKSELTKNA